MLVINQEAEKLGFNRQAPIVRGDSEEIDFSGLHLDTKTYDVLYAQLGQTWSESDKSIIKYLYRTHSCPRHVQFHPQQSR